MTSVTQTLIHPLSEVSPHPDFPWRDNAYLAFWSPGTGVRGVVHVSTSPNALGRRARASVEIDGSVVEVIEELAPGTFTSESIHFGQDGHVRVAHPGVDLDLQMTPTLAIADYSATNLIPDLVEDEPLQHFQQKSLVAGTVRVRRSGQSVTRDINGTGLRDRTFGFRDESASITEYIAVMVDFGNTFVTAMKFKGNDGKARMDGFALSDIAIPVTDLKITRDAAGLLCGFGWTAGSESAAVRRTSFDGGFWVPMGVERTGPTFSAYDEFITVDGGAGVIEQGILRTLF